MKIIVFIPALLLFFVSSCIMNSHTIDHVASLGEGETEVMANVAINVGGLVLPEANCGLGLGGKIGLTPRATLGITADFNYNFSQFSLVNPIFYGQMSVEQKFEIVRNGLAIKFREGVFYNNFHGNLLEDAFGVSKLPQLDRFTPFFSSSIYMTDRNSRDDNVRVTVGLHGFVGMIQPTMPYSCGGSIIIDFAKHKERFLGGVEIGVGIQSLQKNGESLYLSLGFFFSKFKRVLAD